MNKPGIDYLFLAQLLFFNTLLYNNDLTVGQKNVEKYLAIPHTWRLDTPEAITEYLPARLKTLVSYVEQNGLGQTISWIEQDPDLDSFLFIVQAEQPYRLLAYSRSPELIDKTPQELQKILLPTASEAHYSIERSIKEIATITKKITTYTGYWWSAPVTHKPQHYIAYTTAITREGTTYILGATLPHNRVEAHIILPNRIKQVIALIQKEGIDTVAQTINQELEYDYFFIISLQYPYRFITHKQPWAGLTAKQARTLYSPACNSPDCDLVAIVDGLVHVAKEGGGYYVYLWRDTSKKEATLKITYLQPFTYEGSHYLVGTGLPADITGSDAQQLENFVQHAVNLVKEIGFKNTISAIKRINTPDRYLFVDEAQPPYRYELNINEHFNGKTADEVQRYLDSFGKSPITLQDLARTMSAASKRGGGFIAYEFLTDAEHPDKGTALKIAFVRPVAHNNTTYNFGTGIPIERSLKLST